MKYPNLDTVQHVAGVRSNTELLLCGLSNRYVEIGDDRVVIGNKEYTVSQDILVDISRLLSRNDVERRLIDNWIKKFVEALARETGARVLQAPSLIDTKSNVNILIALPRDARLGVAGELDVRNGGLAITGYIYESPIVFFRAVGDDVHMYGWLYDASDPEKCAKELSATVNRLHEFIKRHQEAASKIFKSSLDKDRLVDRLEMYVDSDGNMVVRTFVEKPGMYGGKVVAKISDGVRVKELEVEAEFESMARRGIGKKLGELVKARYGWTNIEARADETGAYVEVTSKPGLLATDAGDLLDGILSTIEETIAENQKNPTSEVQAIREALAVYLAYMVDKTVPRKYEAATGKQFKEVIKTLKPLVGDAWLLVHEPERSVELLLHEYNLISITDRGEVLVDNVRMSKLLPFDEKTNMEYEGKVHEWIDKYAEELANAFRRLCECMRQAEKIDVVDLEDLIREKEKEKRKDSEEDLVKA